MQGILPHRVTQVAYQFQILIDWHKIHLMSIMGFVAKAYQIR